MKNRNKIIMIFILTQSLKVIADNVSGLGDSGAPEAGMFQLKYKIK